MDIEIPLNRRSLLLALGLIVGLVLLFLFARTTPRYIEPARIWSVVQAEASARDLDPRFVFAIVMAESSGNANAESDVARGLMQLTEDTWRETTDAPYHRAFDWPTNLAVGTQHLANLRDRLTAGDRFSYARLAVAYRYGMTALANRDYDVRRFRRPHNAIYRDLFAGRLPPLSDWGV